MGQYLIPLCADPWFSEADISFDGLPNQFVMKATHGCKMNHICLDMANTKREELSRLQKLGYAQTMSVLTSSPIIAKSNAVLFAKT